MQNVKPPEQNNRQSSTSSENIVFSTKLGSNNEIFTTKLPKEKQLRRSSATVSENEIEISQAVVEPEKKKVKPEPPIRRSPSIKKNLASTPSRSPSFPEKPPSQSPSFTEKTPSKSPSFTEKTPIKSPSFPEKPPSKSPSYPEKPPSRECSVHKIASKENVMVPSPVEKKIELVQETIQNVSIPSAEEEFVNEVKKKLVATETRNSVMSSVSVNDEDRYSSESERDSEFEFLRGKNGKEKKVETVEITEPERKGLVLQQDSFEDELPYIPTTLPLERSVAIPIVPIKQRGKE